MAAGVSPSNRVGWHSLSHRSAAAARTSSGSSAAATTNFGCASLTICADLALAIQDIHRHKDHAQLHACKEQFDHFHAVGEVNANPVSRSSTLVSRARARCGCWRSSISPNVRSLAAPVASDKLERGRDRAGPRAKDQRDGAGSLRRIKNRAAHAQSEKAAKCHEARPEAAAPVRQSRPASGAPARIMTIPACLSKPMAAAGASRKERRRHA